MQIRSVATVVRAEGVWTTSRLAMGHLRASSVDRLKVPLGPALGVEFWAAYNRRRAELLYDSRSVAEPLETRWVDPMMIRKRPIYGYFDKLTNIGSVRGGVWDYSVADAADHPTIRGLHQRFEDGYAWEDTVYYRRNVEAIEAGSSRKGCSTAEEFLTVRCAYFDTLFERIRMDGYRTQAELDGAMIDTNRFEMNQDRLLTNEVGVNIGRDGSFLINSGFHRLAIAKILRLEEIPVQIIVRHRDWQRTRAAALDTAFESIPPTVRSHPDMVDVLDTTSRRVAS